MILKCEECGKTLTGHQKKWCSEKCRDKGYRQRHRENIKEKQREKYHNDPEYREKIKRQSKELRREKMKDPEFREKQIRRSREYHQKRRIDAVNRLASLGLGLVCFNCGCPHISGLIIGHGNDDGAEHKREVGNIPNWVLKSSDEEILAKNIRLECYYCNCVKAYANEYPQGDELPIWRDIE